jgi:hypothetical protein
MKIILGLAILLIGLYLHIRYKIEHFTDNMTPEQRAKWEEAISIEQERAKNYQAPLKSLTVYRILQNSIHEGMSLDEMIDAFARMYETPVGQPDDLLFETGTFDFTGEKLFYFSLVRQFQFMNEDEYVQLHLDVLYRPSLTTKLLFGTKWDSQVNGDFFEMVKSSRAFAVVKDMTPVRVEVRIEET